jgi:hypothetical protein
MMLSSTASRVASGMSSYFLRHTLPSTVAVVLQHLRGALLLSAVYGADGSRVPSCFWMVPEAASRSGARLAP